MRKDHRGELFDVDLMFHLAAIDTRSIGVLNSRSEDSTELSNKLRNLLVTRNSNRDEMCKTKRREPSDHPDLYHPVEIDTLIKEHDEYPAALLHVLHQIRQPLTWRQQRLTE